MSKSSHASSVQSLSRIMRLKDVENFSPQLKYMIFHIFIYILHFYGYITNSQSDQLPDGLIAQSVEHCTGIAEVMSSNPVQA